MAKIIKLESKKRTKAINKAMNASEGELELPDQYEKRIKQNPLDEKAYHRIMILYRKLKEYKKELNVINRAIRSFEAFHRSQGKKTNKSIQSISNKLNRALGLVDNKGKSTYDREPVAGWKRRKKVVMRKIKHR
ncbi:MAG: hypothetical protein QM737_16165 [Ferruginibacter sp.]